MPGVRRLQRTCRLPGINMRQQRRSFFNQDYPLGREMLAKRVARQFCRLFVVHGRFMDDEQAAQTTANRPRALAQARRAAKWIIWAKASGSDLADARVARME